MMYSQTYLISTQGTQNTCSGDFYDSGGGGSIYTSNENYVMTFHSTSGTNTHIKMSFNQFDVDPSDTLYVYDGSTIGSPLIGAYNNTNPLTSTSVQASISNVSGDLTFKFKSNAVTQAAGWFASVVCIPLCQQIWAAVDTLVFTPLPNDSNYVDICHGDTIKFAALGTGPGVFPENNILYAQDAATSLFIWNFGDGTIDTGQVISHYYPVTHGYDVSLMVVDNHGCFSTNFFGMRVRISDNPIGAITPLPNICPQSDTIEINVGYGTGNVIQVVPVLSQQGATQSFDSTMFIPDGPYCPSQCYNTYVTFNSFLPGQTITSINDILSVCVNMEHSYAGDLGFTIICPNGQQVNMDPNTHSGGAFLGTPNETDGGSTCDPAQNPPGIGAEYCWSQFYTPTPYTFDQLSNLGGTIPPTDTIAHTGYIAPNNSFAGLIGCPLNGTWNIQICDDFGIDNGYIFSWTLNLDPSLLPQGWSYNVPIDSIGWSGNFIVGTSDSSIFIVPDSGGVFYYTMTVYDAFGCSYDTTLFVSVFPNTDVNAGSDQVVCDGTSATLTAGSIPTGTIYNWSNGGNTATITVSPTGTQDYYITVTDVNGCKGYDTVKVTIGNNPEALINAPLDVCDLNIDFIGSGSNVATPDVINTYAWVFGDGGTANTVNTSHTYAATGTYNIGLSVVTDNGCVDTIWQTLTIHDPITTNVGPDTILNEGQVATVTSSTGGPGHTYIWSTGETGQSIQVTMPGVYTVTVTDQWGCIATDFMEVFPGELTIPNVITPNGDGFNDAFHVKNLYQYPNSKLLVYNRWGKKVYEDANYQSNWDGKGYADGVYFYVLSLADGRSFNGTITLLRNK